MTYLSDGKGNQITPTIKIHGTPDPLPLNAGKSPTKAYHRAHRNITHEQKARAEAASLRFHSQLLDDPASPKSPYQTSAPAEILASDVEDNEDVEETSVDEYSDESSGESTLCRLPGVNVQVYVPSRLGREMVLDSEGEEEEGVQAEENHDEPGHHRNVNDEIGVSDSSNDPLA
jgi:hypothetical protein